MNNNDKVTTTTISKNAVIALAQRNKRQQFMRMFIATLGALTSISAILWFYSQQSLTIIGTLVLTMWAMGSVMYIVFLSRQENSGFNMQNTNQSLFTSWQKDLRLKINIIRFISPLVLFQFLALIVLILFKGIMISHGVAIIFAISLMITLYILYQYCFTLPSLRKELKLVTEE